MSFASAVLTFWLVMDPLGNVPMFITALKTVAPERRLRVVAREQLIALGIMVAFRFAGRGLMGLLHVTPEALTIGGGVILLLIAIRMIFPTQERNLHEAVLGEPLIVPLAVPYTAGPSLLATEVLFVSNAPDQVPLLLGALVVAWALSAAILLSSGVLQRHLGERALTAVERLMGMILVIISVQMVLTGIQAAR